MFKTNPRVVGDPTKVRPARICYWPGCQGKPDPVFVPFCFEHIFIAYQIFCNNYISAFDDLVEEAKQRHAARQPERRPTQGVVYFARLGSLVKIGFSTNLKERMAAVPHEELLGTVPGTMKDEKRCHAAFAHLRTTGEWFRAEPDLLAFINDVAES